MKTKLIILAIVIIVLGGGWYYYKNYSTLGWKTYKSESLGFEFKYSSFLYPTSDAPKDKYCNKPYDNIFLQSSAEDFNVRIITEGSFCTWEPFPSGDKSYSQSTLNIGGFQVSKFVKTGVERDIPLAYTFIYNDKVIDIFGAKAGIEDSYSESIIEQIISSFKFTK